ncbi:26S proteasome non-ATPase regulatory subunit 12-like [Limulus polyphemus]|uniref:26S proteasome non-ATPase regulatory subunit 12-like n=1 Tax=Limulus polyphemus TaxID=6850 RepID=A0ABM1C4Y2_LIMPO|nr:26S proteasome non-ATPase regulatory subunit 12-like [Limulus polyphemus]
MTTEAFTDSGRILKMEVDYSATIENKVPQSEKLAKEGKLSEALDILLTLEKQTRTGADTHSTSKVLVAIVRLCFEAKDYKALNENIVLLTKRRSQIKQSVTKMIQECCSYVDQMPDKETQLLLIDTLRTVTAGKIYVEVERARLTHKLAKMKEDEGNTEEAATIIQELQALKNVVLYLILSPFDNEQSDLIHRLKEDKNLEEIPKFRDLLKLFITPELIRWEGLCQGYEEILKEGTSDCPATGVFSKDEMGEKHWEDMKNRVVEHNIRIMAKYYMRVTLKRMSELLELSPEETEEVLSNLVVNKTVWAKADRLAGIINFSQQKDPNEVLNDWSRNLNSLMQLVNKTTHLINKEEMIHKHLHVEA